MNESDIENIIIVGSGPAGFTAALYASRANLEPLMFEGYNWGGQLRTTGDVENYPGYPDGVGGPEMMDDLRKQAERFGTRIVSEDVARLELSSDGSLHGVFVGDQEYRARVVILSMGAEPKKLGTPGEQELSSRGVSYCATCDAAFFEEMPTVVVGGGDTAMEDAFLLSKFASDVTVVHRRAEFRASGIMLDRVQELDNVEFLTPYVVDCFEDSNGTLGKVRVRNVDNDEERELEVDGAFVAIGFEPNSALVEGKVDMDDAGYVVTEGKSTKTNLPGVFAAGDLVDHTYRQAVTAAGSGCQAALDAEWYLRDT
ncbi:MAG TPA: thioredoxin-disulfide reductase, partial [Thermoleophilaceae bacterium]|nr:thioredoxin-disulfide reductase [Thermoleophilaceae bacterium]